MNLRFVEVTDGFNWGKFAVCVFNGAEWEHKSVVDGLPLLHARGWSRAHVLVLDVQTGEGAIFQPAGFAKADLDSHRIWVCPMFEPFLTWLYAQPYMTQARPDIEQLPEAAVRLEGPKELYGYRRSGASTT